MEGQPDDAVRRDGVPSEAAQRPDPPPPTKGFRCYSLEVLRLLEECRG